MLFNWHYGFGNSNRRKVSNFNDWCSSYFLRWLFSLHSFPRPHINEQKKRGGKKETREKKDERKNCWRKKKLESRDRKRNENYPFMVGSSRCCSIIAWWLLFVLIWIGTFVYILYVYSALTFISWNVKARHLKIVPHSSSSTWHLKRGTFQRCINLLALAW